MNSSTTQSSTIQRSPKLLPDLSLFGVALIWGINLPVMKVGLEHINVYAFNAIRLFISAGVLVAIAYRDRPWKVFQLPAKTKWNIFQYAVIASGLYQVLFLLGIAYASSANAALIMSTVPMWTALLALVFLKERLSRLAWGGLFIALAGTLIVTGQNGISGDSDDSLGNLIMLVAALVWATGTVKSRQLLGEVSPLTLSAVSSVSMLPLHFVIAAPYLAGEMTGLTNPQVWVPVIYSGVFSTGVALVMWNYGVREAGAAHAAIYQNLVPVIAMTSAFIVRGESVTSVQIVGGVLIIGGLVVMRKARARNLAVVRSRLECTTPAYVNVAAQIKCPAEKVDSR
ncbi:DMT family transporter [Thalassoglobus polymorphus]|uniref:DMT family transporter n=1 Tax=Thalassoglobus polymorphus TaxID=2527994 RepID=UPI0018D258FA|nr:DMT family transporter [Thalassoglobus polymorphus]